MLNFKQINQAYVSQTQKYCEILKPFKRKLRINQKYHIQSKLCQNIYLKQWNMNKKIYFAAKI